LLYRRLCRGTHFATRTKLKPAGKLTRRVFLFDVMPAPIRFGCARVIWLRARKLAALPAEKDCDHEIDQAFHHRSSISDLRAFDPNKGPAKTQ
jgi:hypothetical protein